MKPISEVRFFCIVLSGILLGISISDPAFARSLDEIRKDGEIRLCVAGSSHRLYSRMGKVFAEHLGVEADIIKLPSWDRQFHHPDGATVREAAYTPHLLENGDCDCYPNDLVMHEWRKRKLDFVQLFKTRMTVVVNKKRLPNYKSVADLKGKKAAVMKGTTYHTWLEEVNRSELAEHPVEIAFMTTDESMKAVDEGKADFSVIGADGALNWTRNKVKNSATAFFVGPVTYVGWAFRKGESDLQEAARKFFETQREVGSAFDEIWKEEVGISLSDYLLFISTLTGE